MARWTMAHRLRSRQLSKRLPIWALLTVSVAGQCPSDAAALSLLRQPVGRHAAGVILIEEMSLPAATKDGDQQRAPLAELHEALAAARARLEVLADTAAVVAAGQLRQELEAVKEENQLLLAEVAALHASRETLRAASQGAEARIAESIEAAKDAAEKAKRLDEELTTLRRQNEQLRTSLAGAESIREALTLEARKTQDALAAEAETLSEAAEQSAAENARLGAALQEAEAALRIALNSTSAAQARLAELQSAAQSAEADKTRLDEALVRKQAQLAQVEEERDQARAEVAEVQSEAAGLRLALAEAKDESDQVARSSSNLQEEVARLRSAASSATDTARQNLRAVESRIKELNAALVGIQSASEDEGVVGEGLSGAGSLDSGFEAPLAEKWENAAGGPEPSAPTAATDDTETVAEMTTETVIDADLELIKPAAAAEVQLDDMLAQLAVGLPLEKRLQVQGLLVDLGADIDTRGLELIVPGEDLFATDSDAIKPTAYDALAKLAELIEAFDQRQVLIVGHTDSVGEEAYNQILSERRADLVKQFFIDEFDMDGTRLSTEGRGEDQPIASNSTRLGREANRRVEILLLN